MNSRFNGRRQCGFTLIEVLVTIVILSIGLLGFVALQLTSIQQNQRAYMRSQATQLAYNIADRMRSNMAQVTAGSYFAAAGAANGNCINYTAAAAGCTPIQMAANDLAEWQAALANELISGGGRVCRSDRLGDVPGTPDCEGAASDEPVVIYVWWDDDGDQVLDQIVVSTQL